MLISNLICCMVTALKRSSRNLSTNKKISRLLIANRGEIALRVIRTARRMDIETVAVYSDADRNSLHVTEADSAYHIGQSSSAQSYLNMDRIIEVAKIANVQAVHPGYGFLSENATFAEKCEKAGLIFIGPSPNAIRDMGAKDVSKRLMADSGVPIIRGYHGINQNDQKLREEAALIGYPVMLKAVHGGGGKGMRIVCNEKEFDEKLASARSEALKAFGNASVIVEKFIERPRHVEVQIFGDTHGNQVYIWERDCSIQRRHQKIIEEAPAPGITKEIRKQLGETAVQASKAIGYVGAGTVEFIMDKAGQFYFMEMNTRLQVEHPVTEAISGLDLVEWQLRVAEGKELPLSQEQIKLNGHAIEARIYAEDTTANFMPTAGKLLHLSFPSSVRVDTGVQEGDDVSVYYDPMIAKIIAWDTNREKTILKLQKALNATHIVGVPTNINFVSRVLSDPDFQKGDVYTDFISDHENTLFEAETPSWKDICDAIVAHHLLACFPYSSKNNPFQMNDDFRVNHKATKKVALNKNDYQFSVLSQNMLQISFEEGFKSVHIENYKINYPVSTFTTVINNEQRNRKAVLTDNKITIFGEKKLEYLLPSQNWLLEDETEVKIGAFAPMSGTIEKLLVSQGDRVTQGQPLIVMVAMKMEYTIRAPYDAVIESLLCFVGDNVVKDSPLVRFGS